MSRRAPYLICILVVSLLAGCGDGGSPEQQAGLKIYRHSEDGSPSTFDPVQAAVIYSNIVVLNTYDTLYRYKYLERPYELAPNLATGMPEVSDDGLTYTIRIRQGARFIDDPVFPDGKGREVTTEDFVYSIKRHFDPSSRSQGAWLWQGRIVGLDEWKERGANYDQPVEGLQAVDPYTIRIRLTKPYPQLIYTLAMGFSALVPREAVEKYGRELATRPVGSGPFKLDSFTTQRAVFSPNPNYRREPVDLAYEGYDETLHGHLGIERIDGRAPPFVDRLEIHFIQESASRWNSFTKGDEIHYTWIPQEQIDQVVAQKQPTVKLKPEYAEKYQSYVGMEAGFVYGGFNMWDPAFGPTGDAGQDARNKALRCAIRKGFDWPARIDRFYSGIGQAFPGVITPAVPEVDPDLSRESVTRDIEGARRLLAEHGWTPENLPELRYGATSSVQQQQFFEQFRGFMSDIGYPSEKIKFERYATFGDFNRALKQAQMPYFSLGWGLDYPDAENTLQLFYGPNHSPGSNNFNYANPEYDRLFEQAAVMQPGPERTEIYRRMNRLVIGDCVTVSGFSRTRVHLWPKSVHMLPDREILGGFFLKFVDVVAPGGQG